MTEDLRHCCDEMTRRASRRCEEHPDPFDCADKLVHYSARSGRYGLIIHDGGSSSVRIDYCPWCGARLPDSGR